MNILTESLQAPTIGKAIILIQRALGIEDGGVATWTISHEQKTSWAQMDRDARCACLSNYLKVEVYFGTVEEETAC